MRKLPRFVIEGYAIYMPKYVKNPLTGKIKKDEIGNPIHYHDEGGFDFIGLKANVPRWAVDEYKTWKDE